MEMVGFWQYVRICFSTGWRSAWDREGRDFIRDWWIMAIIAVLLLVFGLWPENRQEIVRVLIVPVLAVLCYLILRVVVFMIRVPWRLHSEQSAQIASLQTALNETSAKKNTPRPEPWQISIINDGRTLLALVNRFMLSHLDKHPTVDGAFKALQREMYSTPEYTRILTYLEPKFDEERLKDQTELGKCTGFLHWIRLNMERLSQEWGVS